MDVALFSSGLRILILYVGNSAKAEAVEMHHFQRLDSAEYKSYCTLRLSILSIVQVLL